MSVEVSHIASRVHRLASPSEARTWLTRLCQEPSICQREGLSRHQKLELQLTSFDASATFWLMPRGQALKAAASPGAFRRLHARLPESAFDTAAARRGGRMDRSRFSVNARRNTRPNPTLLRRNVLLTRSVRAFLVHRWLREGQMPRALLLNQLC